RRDHLRRLPDRPVRGRVRLPRAPGGAGGCRRRLAGRAPRNGRQGVRRARRGARAGRAACRGRQGLCPRTALGLCVSTPHRVRLRAAEDAEGEAPPRRAERARARARGAGHCAGVASIARMFAVYAARVDADDPLSALELGDRPEPDVPDGWTTVAVRAASLNRHDLWSLRGVGLPPDRLPMILGCDAAGIDEDGNDVVVHSVITSPDWRDDETLDPGRTILSEFHPGTFAERVAVPARNLVPKPAELSFEEAACLPTAWLTAYRMLFTKAN